MDYKKDFPIFNNRNITYLDSGATTQKPQYVIDAIDEFYEHNNANPHRGAYSLSIDATNVYEGTREKIAKFINARKAKEIILMLFFKIIMIQVLIMIILVIESMERLATVKV